MEKKKQEIKTEIKMENKNSSECSDDQCTEHGTLAARGRIFEGIVTRKFPKRITIEFERTVFIKKYERYIKTRTKLHARVSSCKEAQVSVGDYVQIQECRPLSKIIHFVYLKTIRTKEAGR